MAGGAHGERRRTLRRFMAECMYDFHAAAREHGVVHGMPVIERELLKVGWPAVKGSMESEDLLAEFDGNERVFCDYMVMRSIDYGLLLAALWFANEYTFEYAAKMAIKSGPVIAAHKLIDQLFDQKIMENEGEAFFDLIAARWFARTAPHEEEPDAHQYRLYALMAAYQLGVTMMLQRCEYDGVNRGLPKEEE